MVNKTLFSILLLSSLSLFAKTTALFSPRQGDEAFEKIYSLSANAKKKLYVTAYSWSDKSVLESMLSALKNGVEVKLILHPSLARNKRVIGYSKELEANGADVKIATMNMHEKFFIIDEDFLINSSANLSSGAKNKYSENFIFHEIETKIEKNLLKEFNREFTILWNTGKDFFSNDESTALALPDTDTFNIPTEDENSLYSSSMNFTLDKNAQKSKDYLNGRYYALEKRGGKINHTWVVRDMIIKNINEAKVNVLLSINHLNIREVSDALIEAVKRGVDVRLVVDNQEFKRKTNKKEMTPQFVKDYRSLKLEKELPVRVKFYSFNPSPRYWFLNHHKFLIIDYNDTDLSHTKLISGSYNISRTAEQAQFDNMVIYQGSNFPELMKSFKNEFDYLWGLNRDSDKHLVSNIIKVNDDNSIYVHLYEPVSLKWEEVENVMREVYKVAPNIFNGGYRFRDCRFFSIEKNSYFGCP